MLSYWPPCPQGRGQCPARRRCPGHAPRIFPENRGLAGPPTEVPACLIRHPDKPRPSLGSVSVCGTGRAASLADFTWLRSSHTGRWSGQRGRVRMRAPGRRPCRASRGAGGPRCRLLCAGRNADSTEAPHADGAGRPAGLFLNVGRSGGHERGPRHPSWLAPRTAARPNARSEAQHAPDAPAVPTARPLPPGFQVPAGRRRPSPGHRRSGLCLCPDTVGTGGGRRRHQRGGWRPTAEPGTPRALGEPGPPCARTPCPRLLAPRLDGLGAPRAPPRVWFSDKAPVDFVISHPSFSGSLHI